MLHALVQVNNCSRVGHLDHQAPHSSQSEMASVKAKNLERLITVAGRGKISEPSTAGTLELDWRCFEYLIDGNEFHIHTNLRKI